jgi:uncharacterized membrane protein
MSANYQMAFGIFTAVVAMFVAGLFHKIPDWTRPDIFFSVTVSPDFRATPEARSILRNYRAQVWLATLVSFALIFLGADPARIYLIFTGEILLIVGSFAAFLAARRRVLPHFAAPSTVRVASLAPRPAHLPGGWIGQSGPFAILFASGLWLRAHWDHIPGRFPIHWDLYGHPNGWAERTPRGVYGPLLISGSVLAILLILSYGILTRSRRVGADVTMSEAGLRGHDFMHRMLVGMLAIEYGMALLFAYIGILPLLGQPAIGMTMAVVLIFLAATFVLVGWLSRARTFASAASSAPAHVESAAESYHKLHPAAGLSDSATTGQFPAPSATFSNQGLSDQNLKPAGDGTPDANWKLGVLYFNPDDAAIFVEKRFGVGYTMNFARPMAWVILGAILLLPIVIAILAIKK